MWHIKARITATYIHTAWTYDAVTLHTGQYKAKDKNDVQLDANAGLCCVKCTAPI